MTVSLTLKKSGSSFLYAIKLVSSTKNDVVYIEAL